MSNRAVALMGVGGLILFAVLTLGIKYLILDKSNISSVKEATYASLPDLKSAPFGVAPPDPNDVQIDTQNNSMGVVTYRPDLSKSSAVFDVDIKSSAVDLSKYNYQKNLVLADTNIEPLASQQMLLIKNVPGELQIRFVTIKYPGTHFHFLLENLDGITDRVLHFYHTI